MKERAPRNRTLTIEHNEVSMLMDRVIKLSDKTKPSKIENQIIYQDYFDCIDYLPDEFIDLLIVDPPYNLTKKYAGNIFSKKNR